MAMRSLEYYSNIVATFDIQGLIKEVIPWGNGHINCTYKVVNKDQDAPDYILQRVNNEVFDDVEKLMENQKKVIQHVASKQNNHPLHHLSNKIFQSSIPRRKVDSENNNNSYSYLYRNEDGWWRMSEFADGYTSYDLAPNENVASQAGTTIGCMVLALSNFKGEDLHITIPDFHNIRHRMEQLDMAWSGAKSERRGEAGNIMTEIEMFAPAFLDMYDAAVSGALPLRATHNDTKFNNLLLDEGKDVGIVVDLDTLMPGYSFFDTGDALRSGMIAAQEDESDLTKVTLNKEAYDAFVNAFLETAKSVLTPKEVEFIPMSGGYMSFMLAVRFLTDYLNGDVYFPTSYTKHNLIRARCQLKVSTLFREL
jgi:Ser/Thr protein kinase RdoA (MazF antagonist)